jgi:hypothetical protein
LIRTVVGILANHNLEADWDKPHEELPRAITNIFEK